MTKRIRRAGLARSDPSAGQTCSTAASVDADSGETIAITNPPRARGSGTPEDRREETRRAIEAARRALPEWRGRPSRERALILRAGPA